MTNLRKICLILTTTVLTYAVLTIEVTSAKQTDGLIEQNPDYRDPPSALLDDTNDEDDPSSSDGSPSDDDSEYESEYDNDEESSLETIFARTKKTTALTLSYVQKNRTEVTVALALFAFRREIWRFVYSCVTSPTEDGKGRKLKFSVGPTVLLKILLFLDFMRKMQSGGGANGGDAGSKGMPGRAGGSSGFLQRLLLPTTNTAFIPSNHQHYTFERINDRYYRDGMAYEKAMGPFNRDRNRSADVAMKNNKMAVDPVYNSTIVIMELLNLDLRVSNIDIIRDKVSFLLYEHRRRNKNNEEPDIVATDEQSINEQSTNDTTVELEVIIPLESYGGTAMDYGLAAQQIGRLRNEPGIKVTICVDKVAASGGYMMACMSSPDQLFAAPFAMVGSIGVVTSIMNIHKPLVDLGVRTLLFTGGEHKAPITLTSEVTEEGMEHVQKQISQMHVLFKRHVVAARPGMEANIDSTASGEAWYGYDALELGLVDRIVTSDEYISEKVEEGSRVLKLVSFERMDSFMKYLMPYRVDGSMGVLSGFVRSFSDFVGQLRTTLGKINDVMEGSPSEVVMAQALGVRNIHVAKR